MQIMTCMKHFLENFLIDLEEALSPWNFNTGSTVHNGFYEFVHIFKQYIEDHGQWKRYQQHIANVSIIPVIIIFALQISRDHFKE